MNNYWYRYSIVLTMYIAYVSAYVTGCDGGRDFSPKRENGRVAHQRAALPAVQWLPPPVLGTRNVVLDGTVDQLSAGSLAVSASGEATWSMPLDLLPGRNGLAPQLVITYRSRAGDGVLGRGFGLSGLSSIARCWGTPADSGRAAVGAEKGLAPHFCLDGARLIQREIGDPTRLSPEMDPSTMVRVVGGADRPESFTVLTADGRISYFGSRETDAHSKLKGFALEVDGERLFADGPFATDSLVNVQGTTERTVTWFVDRVTDRYENFIDYNYDVDVDANTGAQEVLIRSIDWTGSTSGMGRLEPQRKAVFTYGNSLNNPRSGFAQGLRVKQTLLLESMSIIGPDGLNSMPNNKPDVLWTYYFAYQKNQTGRAIEKLTSVTKCVPSGACAEPLVMKWLGEKAPLVPQFRAQSYRTGTDFFNDNSSNSSALFDVYDLSVGDLNGDGRDDVLYRVPLVQNGAATYTSFTIDRGGGWPLTRTVAASQWRVRLGGLKGLGIPLIVTGLPEVRRPGWEASVRLVDWDRDGRDEVLAYETTGIPAISANYDIYSFNGTGFIPSQNTPLEVLPRDFSCLSEMETGECWMRRSWPVALGDMDGDGSLDLLRDSDPSWSATSAASTVIAIRPKFGTTLETLQELVSVPGVPSFTTPLDVFVGSERLMVDTDRNGQVELITDFNHSTPDPARIDQFPGGPSPLTGWTLSSFAMAPRAGFATGALVVTQTALPAGPLEYNSGSSVPSLTEAAFGRCNGDLLATQRTPFTRLTGDYNGDGLRDVLSLPGRFSTDCGCVIDFLGNITCPTVVDYSTSLFRNWNAGSGFAAAETLPNFVTAPSPNFTSQTIPSIVDLTKATAPEARYRGLSRPVDNGLRAIDIDRDGRDDLVQVSAVGTGFSPTTDSMRWFRSIGEQFVEHVLAVPLAPHLFDNSSASGFGGNGPRMTQFGDFNGDGLVDIVSMDTSVFAYLQDQREPDLVVEISRLHVAGSVVEYQLGLANSGSAYNLYGTCVAPQTCRTNLGWIVSTVHLPGGVRQQHSYEDAVEDTRGRGRLGVRVHIVDTRDPIGLVVQTVRDEYDLDSIMSAALAWRLPSTSTFHSAYEQTDVPTLRRITNADETTEVHTSSRLDLGGGGYSEVGVFSLLRRVSIVTTKDRTGVLLRSSRTVSDYDEYGNRVSRTVTTSDLPLSGTASSQNLTKAGDWEEQTTRLTGRNNVCLSEGGQCGEGWLIARYPESLQENSAARLPNDVAVVKTAVTYEPTSPDVQSATTDIPFTRRSAGSEFATTVTFARDGRGAKTSVTRSTPTPASGTVSSPLSRTTDFSFHPDDEELIFPWMRTGPLGFEARAYRHAATGSLIADDDVNGLRTEFEYDELFRLVLSRPPVGKTTTTEYGARTATLYVAQSNAQQNTEVTINRLGQTIHQRSAGLMNESETTTEYDAFGRVSAQSLPYTRYNKVQEPPKLRFSYDSLGRPTEVSRPGETLHAPRFKKTMSYSGLTMTETSERGIVTETTRDTRGRVREIAVTDPLSGQTIPTRYDYWHLGLVSVVHHPENVAGTVVSTQLTYDDLGRRVQIVDPDSGTERSFYSGFGELIGTEDGNGATTARTFDALGRMLTETTPLASAYATMDSRNPNARNNVFEYDLDVGGIGRLGRATSLAPTYPGLTFDGSVQADYEYDAFGRQHNQAWRVAGNTYEVSLSYDNLLNRLLRVQYPSFGGQRLAVEYEYDTDGSAVGVSRIDISGKRVPIWRLLGQNAAGQTTEELFGDRTVSTHRYDDSLALRYLETSDANMSGAPAAQRLAYTWGPDQLLSRRYDLDMQSDETYTHDAVGRLVKWKVDQNCVPTTWDYGYDDAGNLTSKMLQVGTGPQTTWASYSYTGTAPHAASDLTISGSTNTFQYLPGGQLERDAGRMLNWTPFGLPWRITDLRGDTDLSYDAFGRRVLKSARGERTVTIGGLFELRPDASATKGVRAAFNVYGRNGLVAQLTQDLDPVTGHPQVPEPAYIHADHLGNPDSVTTETAGGVVVLERGKYEPFGERRNPWALAHPISQAHSPMASYGFTGHEPDESLGLTNMRGRIYDPRLSRFLSADPLADGSSQSLNRYSYVRNSPIVRTDPSGLEDCVNECSFDPEAPVNSADDLGGPVPGAGDSGEPATLDGSAGSGDVGTDPVGLTMEAASVDLGTMTYWENVWYEHKLYFSFESRRLYRYRDALEPNGFFDSLGRRGPIGFLLPTERDIWGIGHSIRRNLETIGEYTDGNRDGGDAVFSGLSISAQLAALVAMFAAPEAAPLAEGAEMLGILRLRVRQLGGFAMDGPVPVIVDNSLGVNPARVAEVLRSRGINARTVGEVFGGVDPGDASIRRVAEVIHGRVLSSDRGRVLGTGFDGVGIHVPNRVKGMQDIILILDEAGIR